MSNYAPFNPSRLGSSPSTTAVAPTSSDLPSSPTTASFYFNNSNTQSSIPRTQRPRLYKSQSSSRKNNDNNTSTLSSSSPSSFNSNPFRSTIHEQARLQRHRQQQQEATKTSTSERKRALEGFLQGSFVPDEPGGWTKQGEWEEFDEIERERLEIEMIKEKKLFKWQLRLKEEQAEEALLCPNEEEDEEEDDEMEEEEPPPDVLSDYEPPLPSPSLLDPPRLPSLASSLSSSPFLGPTTYTSSSPAPTPEPEPLEDFNMSTTDNSSSGKTITPYDYHTSESLINHSIASGEEEEESESESIQTFEQTLLETDCPSCRATSKPIRASLEGAKCQHCQWGISIDVLRPLEIAFVRHGSTRAGHLPLFSWTPFTGTLVFCQTCDEEFAA